MVPVSEDPRFNRLPQNLVSEIKNHPPTANMGGQMYHEVLFTLAQGGYVSVAVLDHEYVSLPPNEINNITGIHKIVKPME